MWAPDTRLTWILLMTHLTPHDFLKQSLGQRQRLVLNLAVRQCLLELLDAFVCNLVGDAEAQFAKVG